MYFDSDSWKKTVGEARETPCFNLTCPTLLSHEVRWRRQLPNQHKRLFAGKRQQRVHSAHRGDRLDSPDGDIVGEVKAVFPGIGPHGSYPLLISKKEATNQEYALFLNSESYSDTALWDCPVASGGVSTAVKTCSRGLWTKQTLWSGTLEILQLPEGPGKLPGHRHFMV